MNNSPQLNKIKQFLRDYDGEKIRLMEICGSHTRAIAQNGIPAMLSDRIELLSGPGCPVCVAASSYIDRLIALSEDSRNIIVSFGDLLRVPGSGPSLLEAKGQGAAVEMVYSPLDAIELARKNPSKTIIFAAVGFETTAPAYADLVHRILSEKIPNIRLLSAIKTMPPVVEALLDGGANIDGFLAPGHVSVVIGSSAFIPLAERFGIPFVVSGFSGAQLLVALYHLVKNRGRGIVKNDYRSVVSEEGNVAAVRGVYRYFRPVPAVWRGLGEIAGSGLALREEFSHLDAGSEGLITDEKKNPACICDAVLTGRKKPFECPLYGKACTPLHPQGACMVSGEGSCASYLANGRQR